jgi:transcriptional regulator with XRE-family HTH domain
MKLRIRELAEQPGYSIRKLSITTGLAYTTVFRYWHSYISRPDPEVLKKLAQLLEVSDWRTLMLDEE